jgi:hypothetical protein
LKNHNQPHKYEGFKVYNDINYIGTSTWFKNTSEWQYHSIVIHHGNDKVLGDE